jgi:hypothetical protein
MISFRRYWLAKRIGLQHDCWGILKRSVAEIRLISPPAERAATGTGIATNGGQVANVKDHGPVSQVNQSAGDCCFDEPGQDIGEPPLRFAREEKFVVQAGPSQSSIDKRFITSRRHAS